ncbi:MAG: nitrous oxide reductase family maturation protein NosD, partial [Promethearchaeota archaeon]
NNTISGFTGTGVELLNSSDNLIDGNIIDNNAGENAVFLAGSDANTIINNDICDFNTISSSNPSSLGIRSKVQGFISRGIFLDPSKHNVIANNTISGFTGTGVELLNSSDNLIDGNMIDNSEGENAVFLVGSDSNTITNNDIWGSYDSDPSMSPPLQSIKYKIQGFISRGIFLDPSNHNVIANNRISNITGTGLYLLNSNNNDIIENQIANNAEDGILLDGSSNSEISHNVIYDDEFYGISLSSASVDNIVDWNDFIGNNIGGTSQINDDGTGNQFTNNFLVDHDNTDTNNDNVSDNPYHIDGDANSLDYNPYALPVQPLKDLGLALADLEADVDWESETLNLKNQGNWETVKIHLPIGYSATNINVSSIYTEIVGAGRLFAEKEAQVQNPRTLIVKFDRPALVLLLESALTKFPIEVKMNVTGFLNGEFLIFYGYDNVTVINSDPILAIDIVHEEEHPGHEKEQTANNPAKMFIEEVIKPTVAIPMQIFIDQVTYISQKPFGLTIGILFAPMITSIVTRSFHKIK